MKSRRWLKTGVMVAMIFAMVLVMGNDHKATANQLKDLVMITAPPGGSWYPIAAACSEAIQKNNPGTRVDVIQGGGRINPKAVNTGKADFGLAMAITCVDAINAKPPYKTPHKNMRTLINLYEGVYQLCTLKESNIYTVGDFEGKRLMVGTQGSATVPFTQMALSTAGLTFDDLKKAFHVSAANAAQMLKDRMIDGFTTGIGGYPIAAIQDVAASRDVRLISFDDDAINKLQEINAGILKMKIPAGTYNGQEKEVQTFGGVTVLIVRADLPDDTVVKMLDGIFKEKKTLQGVHKLLRNFSMKTASGKTGIPYHPGSVKYFKAHGIDAGK